MINDSLQLENIFSQSYAKYRNQQQALKINMNQIIDPEYANTDDTESVIVSYEAQIDKIKQMCTNASDDEFPEDMNSDQYQFDFPSNIILFEIMKNLHSSIKTMLIPIDLISNSIIFIFLDKILQNSFFFQDDSIINQVANLYVSISCYDYCECMDSIIDKYLLFLENSTNIEISISESVKSLFILALSNLLLDEISQNKLISAEIHCIIYQILIHQQNSSEIFFSCLNYLINFTNFVNSNDKNDQFFINILQFLIENITSNFSSKLENGNDYIQEEEQDEDNEAITVLISELKLMWMILDPLIEVGLEFELENCINLLFILSYSNNNYFCISEYLFSIMKFIGIATSSESTIFTDSSFLDNFYTVYENSSIDAKIQGIELLIIISSLISKDADLFKQILQNFLDTTLDSNFELWRHMTFFAVTILKNADVSKRRDFVDENFVDILTNAVETKIFVKDILIFFADALQSDKDFWEDFLNENDFIKIFSEMSDVDLNHDQESIQLINLLVNN